MTNYHRIEINRLLFFIAGLALLGWMLGMPLLFVMLGFAAYSIWSLYQLVRAARWLQSRRLTNPPESVGLWGEVFDLLYEALKYNRSERKKLRKTISHLRGSFAALSDAVVMVDALGNIDWCNKAAARYLGLKFPQDEHQQLINLLRSPKFIRYFDSEIYETPLKIKSPVNSQLDLEIQITLFGKRNRIIFARDVTRFSQVEQVRKDFVANVSHELRTPLTVINGYIGTFEEMDDQLPPPVLKALGHMAKQTHRMEALVKDLILLTRLESVPAGNKKNQSVDVEHLLEEIRTDGLHTSGNLKTIHIDSQTGLKLLGNGDEIRSAFSNLVYNAVKYTEENGEIWLRWWSDQHGAHFSVRDNGIGIDPQHIPRLTERFYRVDHSRSVQTGGTGLGLAIVKHVLMRHGARLEINSRPQHGSEFICHFPLERVAVDLQPLLQEPG